ncbi:hypothetical protein MMC31_007704 [Peltigera leucophlebia]|nr:hypothetical protein [Peltigera leucophlebia]
MPMSRCSEPRELIYGLLNIAKDTKQNPGSIVADYSCSLETLFLQSVSCCPLPEKVYDGIPCLQFCDTLSTRLGVDPGRALACAIEILQSSPTSALAEKMACRSSSRNSPGLVVLSHNLLLRTEIRCGILHRPRQRVKPSTLSHNTPSVKFLERQRCITCGASTSPKQSTLFSSPTWRARPTQASASPAFADQSITNADEYGVIAYGVVGLRVIPQQSNDDEDRECSGTCKPHLRSYVVTCTPCTAGWSSTAFRVTGWMEVGLQELTTLWIFTRVAGSFVR